MSTPFKIICAASFAPGKASRAPVRYEGGLEAMLEAFAPDFHLADPLVDLAPRSLEDFTPSSLIKGRQNLEKDAGAMTALLHHPGFQAMESAWRGLDFAARHLPEQGVELWAFNTSAETLLNDFYEYVFKPEYDGLTACPPGLIILDFDFDHKPGSLADLKNLAKMGQALSAPMVAQADAALLGVKHLLHVPALADLPGRLAGPEYTAYNAFREKDEATWLSLCLNRFLLRLPHQGLGYEEPADAGHPERYLWGRGGWFLAANVARSWGAAAHPADISGMGPGGLQAGLYARELPLSRKEKVKTPLEAILPLPQVEMMPYFGLSILTQTPRELGAAVQADVVYPHLAVNLRHFTDPTMAKPGLLTVYTTLAYSLILGRASNLGLGLLPSLAGLGAPAAAESLKAALNEELGGMARGELAVEAAEGGLHVILKPELKLHEREFAVEFDLPLPA